MTETQAALLSLADQAVSTARTTLDAGDVRAAINRSYYACFYVAQAALLGADERPKSHAGVRARFHARFAAGGAVSASDAAFLSFAASAREQADYDALGVMDPRAAADLVADAEAFVGRVRPLVR